MRNNLIRKFHTFTYAANSTTSVKLPNVHNYRGIKIDLAVSHTNTGSVTILADTPQALINQLQFLVNGEAVRRMDPKHLYHTRLFKYLNPGLRTACAADTGAKTDAFCSLLIDFNDPTLFDPTDTFFDSSEADSVDLEITWNGATALSAASLAVDSASATVYLIERETNANKVNSLLRENFQDFTLSSGANTLDLTTGHIYTKLWLKAMASTGQPSALTDLSAITLSLNGVPIQNSLTAQFKQSELMDLYKVASGDLPTGYMVFDFLRDGRLSSALDTRFTRDLKLDLTSGGTVLKVRVYFEFIVPAGVRLYQSDPLIMKKLTTQGQKLGISTEQMRVALMPPGDPSRALQVVSPVGSENTGVIPATIQPRAALD
jgi:hypothetical protein